MTLILKRPAGTGLILKRPVGAGIRITAAQIIDPDVALYDSKVLSTSNVPLPLSALNTINTMVTTLKTSMLWNSISHLHIFGGPSSLSGASVPIKHPLQSNATITNFTNSDYKSSGIDLGIQDYTQLITPTQKGVSNSATLSTNAAYGVWGSARNGVNLLSSTGSFPVIYQNGKNTVSVGLYSYGANDFAYIAPALLAGDVIAVRESSTSLKTYINGTLKDAKTGSSSSSPGGRIITLLSDNSGQQLSRRHTAYFIANGVTSAQALQIRAIINTCLAGLGYQTGIKTFVYTGDSLTSGYNSQSPYPVFLSSKTGWEGRQVNSATSGWRTGNSAYGLLANYLFKAEGYRPDGYYSTKGLIFVWCGTNDLRDGAAATDVLSNLRSFWSMAKADGYKVIAFTIAPRADTGWTASMNTQRESLNSSIVADSANWDGLIRPDLLFTDPNNTTYFQADKLHFTSAAGQLLADTIAQQIDPSTI